jgi:hypothetical protein
MNLQKLGLVLSMVMASSASVWAENVTPNLPVNTSLATSAVEAIEELKYGTSTSVVHKDPQYGIIKWSGDLRVRAEAVSNELTPSGTQQNFQVLQRNRISLRLGMTSQINEQVKIGIRGATGGASAYTTNQDFSGFQKDTFMLDRAYVIYSANKALRIYGGKMFNFFKTSGLIWDVDVNPDGIGEELEFNGIFLRAAQWSTLVNASPNEGWNAYQAGYQNDWFYLFGSLYNEFRSFKNNGLYNSTIIDGLVGFSLWEISSDFHFANDTANKSFGYWNTLRFKKAKKAGDYSIYGSLVHYDFNFAPEFSDDDFGAGNEGIIAGGEYLLDDTVRLAMRSYLRQQTLTKLNKTMIQADITIKF